jgi:hypothetical protein
MKTSELQGPALDWAVAKCEGRREPELLNDFKTAWFTWGNVHYSTDWSLAGPIIERERLKVVYFASSQEWNVSKLRYGGLCEPHDMKDPSLLVAAMRCYVASKLGDEVEIPEELK